MKERVESSLTSIVYSVRDRAGCCESVLAVSERTNICRWLQTDATFDMFSRPSGFRRWDSDPCGSEKFSSWFFKQPNIVSPVQVVCQICLLLRPEKDWKWRDECRVAAVSVYAFADSENRLCKTSFENEA